MLNRIRSMRGGKLYDATFGKRMRGEGIFADQISQMFRVALRKAAPELSTASFRPPEGPQLDLDL